VTALPPLADDTDLEERLGRELTAAELLRTGGLLKDASASVRNYTHQDITFVEDEVVRIKVRNGKARLPQRPVTAVTAVADLNDNPVLYLWEGFDTVCVSPNVPDTFAWEPWRNGIQAVDITYSHGDNPVGDDIIGVVCSIVLRALGRDPIDAGITQEAIQGYSYSIGSAGAAGGFGLLQAEKDILDAYLRVGGSVRIGL